MSIARVPSRAALAVILASTALLLLGVGGPVSSQNAGVELSVNPAAQRVVHGQTLSLSLRVDNVASLCRAELHLNYDAELEILDTDPGRAGVQIEPGEVLNGCVQWNEAADGVLHFVAQRDPDTGGFSGHGEIARLRLRVAASAPGGYLVAFDRASVRLEDCAGDVIPLAQVSDAQLVIPPTLTGNVTRDGWRSYAGTRVSASLYRAGSSTPVARGQADTGASGGFYLGTWEIPPLGDSPSASPPPGCSTGWVHARLDYPGYLAECYRQCAATDAVDIGWRKLEGGDVNHDGCINIADIVLIIAEYDQAVDAPCDGRVPGTALPGDINGDCRVNILDLTQAAGNFGLCSNCP